MRSRVVLVTGTSSAKSIGYAASRRLASAGHAVYATVRNPETAAGVSGRGVRAAQADGAGPGRIEVRTLDLLDRSMMAPLLADIVAAEGRLDAVVNNAGYGVIGGIEQVDIRGGGAARPDPDRGAARSARPRGPHRPAVTRARPYGGRYRPGVPRVVHA